MTQSILITGASGGIGAATAKLFLNEGWTVGMLARRADALEALADGYDNAVVLPGDVTEPASVEGAVEALVEIHGRLDVLFNNAGIFTPAAPFDEVPLEDWDRALAVNLRGMIVAAQAAFRQMRKQSPMGGRIVNNGSISAFSPREGAGPYTTTKHAISGLTKQISLDGRPFDIACGQIDVGNARTELLEGIIARAQASGEPVPPTMPVDEVARAVWHMSTLPQGTNVQSMTILATNMAYIGRG